MNAEEKIVHDKSVKQKLPPVASGEAGYALGLAGFITSFFAGLVGLILSAIALKQSKAIGRRNTFALAGLIIGIVKTAFAILAVIGLIIAGVLYAQYCTTHAAECSSNSSYYDNSTPGRYDSPESTQTY